MNNDSLVYAGFWPRLCSLFLDGFILAPVAMLAIWASSAFRLFNVYYFVPSMLLALFYNVYLVRRFGGTPGKLIFGIRIRKLDGTPVEYHEAILRYFPSFILAMLTSLACLFPLFHMSDAEYFSLPTMERTRRLVELAPSWYKPVQWTQTIWIWSELLVLLTNRKRRALHDFIAGTVVVRVLPPPPVATPAPAATAS